MYCPVVYGYRNDLAQHLRSAPTLNEEYIEELSQVPEGPASGKNGGSDLCTKRVLLCAGLVLSPIIGWDTWSSTTWPSTLRRIRGTCAEFDNTTSIDVRIQRMCEDLSIEKAEYLLSSDRGATQLRDLRLQRLVGAARAAFRVADRVRRHICQDSYAAVMVGTNTFSFLSQLPKLVVRDYMEFLHHLIGESDGRTRR